MAADVERMILNDEDLEQLPEDYHRHELSKGELGLTAAPTSRHQRAVGNLCAPLHHHNREPDLGTVLIAPVAVRSSEITVGEPNLPFIRRNRAGIIGDHCVEGSLDLIIEVTSPSTARRDRRTKPDLYARYRVARYWPIDTVAEAIEALQLTQRFDRLVAPVKNRGSSSAPPFPELKVSPPEIFARGV